MNEAQKYKQALRHITPSPELIGDTLAQIAKQKAARTRIIRLFVQSAAAACFCIIMGIMIKFFGPNNSVELSGSFVGSIFGSYSYIALPVIVFAMLLFIFVFLYRRKK